MAGIIHIPLNNRRNSGTIQVGVNGRTSTIPVGVDFVATDDQINALVSAGIAIVDVPMSAPTGTIIFPQGKYGNQVSIVINGVRTDFPTGVPIVPTSQQQAVIDNKGIEYVGASSGSVTPTLSLTGPLAYTTTSGAGVLVANIGNVPAGVTPTLTAPTDGTLVIAGGAGAWTVITGMVAGTVQAAQPVAVAATGANPASATAAVTAGATPNYAAVVQNAQPARVLANPLSDSFVVSSAVALSGSAEGAFTWVNYPFGTNPGAHNKQADGSGVGGTSAGRACTVLPYGALDGEISADVLFLVTSGEGVVSLVSRADTTVTTGTFYELRAYPNNMSIYRWSAGTAVQIGTTFGFPTAYAINTSLNILLRVQDVGDGTTSLRAYWNGTEVINGLDATPLTATNWGLFGGRNIRFKNLNLGTAQLQAQTAYTPNVYDQSASGAIVTALNASAAGSTLTLANNDGGRFSLVDTGFTTAGFHQYNLVATSTSTKIADGNARSVQVTEAKTGYTSVTTTLALGVVAPLPARTLRLASAGGLIPNAAINSGSGSATSYQSQVPWYVGSDDKSSLQFTFDNWQLAGGEVTNLNTGFTISKASFHIPGAPIPLVPVTFSGSRALTLNPGDAAILSDPLLPAQFGLKVFPRGTMGWLRSAGAAPAVSGALQNLPAGRYVNVANVGGSFMERGSTTTNAQVDATTNMTSQGGTAQPQSVGATTMVGKSVNTMNILSVFGLGDSIMDGLFDLTYATPYGKSWLPRAASDSTTSQTGGTPASLISFMQGSHSGDSDWALSSGATTRISKYWAYANVLIDEFDTNDIGTAGTGTSVTTMHNNALATWGLYRSASPGGKVLRTTLQPRTIQNITLASVTGDGVSLATATVAAGQPLPAVGATFPINIYGSTPTGYNGAVTGTVTAASTPTTGGTFTYPIASGLASPATGTIGAYDNGASAYFQTPIPGWTSGAARDQIISMYRTDLSNGTIDGILETLAATSPASDPTRWNGGFVTITDSSNLFTHPYQTAGNAPIAAITRTALLNLTGLAA